MLYDYRCGLCRSDTEAANRWQERHSNAPACCGQPMTLIIKTAPMGFVQGEMRYICPVTNAGVTNHRQRREIMARENLVDANDIMPNREKRKAMKAKKDARMAEIKAEEAKVAPEVASIFKQEQQRFLNSL